MLVQALGKLQEYHSVTDLSSHYSAGMDTDLVKTTIPD